STNGLVASACPTIDERIAAGRSGHPEQSGGPRRREFAGQAGKDRGACKSTARTRTVPDPGPWTRGQSLTQPRPPRSEGEEIWTCGVGISTGRIDFRFRGSRTGGNGPHTPASYRDLGNGRPPGYGERGKAGRPGARGPGNRSPVRAGAASRRIGA